MKVTVRTADLTPQNVFVYIIIQAPIEDLTLLRAITMYWD